MRMKIRNGMRRILLIMIMVWSSVAGLFAQGGALSGQVNTLSQGEKGPAAYASIIVLETNKFYECNDKGEFRIEKLPAGNATLVASYVGFASDTLCLSVASDGQVSKANDGSAASVITDGGITSCEFNLLSNTELEALVVTGRQGGNYLSKSANMKTEVISAAGLCKMACCSLAESFENSASVSVGFSDAITGARQIRLLGLSGAYTQMLDENRPVMRGLAAPFGLDYIPGQWLESIQIAKGPSSVINGLEAVTGQINMEHRKPTAENPLFVNLFLNSNVRAEANVASSLQLNDKWYTVIMAHVSKDTKKHDMNDDGFRDDPLKTQFNFDNRWLYQAYEGGPQIRFGLKAVSDKRIGGQMDYKEGMNDDYDSFEAVPLSRAWGSEIRNKGIDGYLKIGVPIAAEGETNIAMVADVSYYDMKSSFGNKRYNGHQTMGFVNIISQNRLAPCHKLSAGLTGQFDKIYENLYESHQAPLQDLGFLGKRDNVYGAFSEYTYDSKNEKLSVIAGLRADYHTLTSQWYLAPRVTLKYSVTDKLIFRANGGRGLRSANVIADNLGMLSSGREIYLEEKPRMEDAWTFGANVSQYFKLGYGEDSYISFDYFRTNFKDQLVVDWDKDLSRVSLYNCKGKSFTDTYQVDLSLEPIEGLTTMLTFRYTNAKVEMDGQGLVDRPLMSKYKGVFNVQYATNLQKWIFDFTAQLNGPSAKPQFIGGGESNPYGLFYFQITKKFRGLDLYGGVENIGNYTQSNPIIDAQNPFSKDFNAAMIWAPLMGRMFYVGMRLTLWK